MLNASSRSARCRHVSVSIFLALGLLNTSSRSARCLLDSTVSIFLALFCSTPRVALLVVDLTRLSRSFLFWFAHNLESFCSCHFVVDLSPSQSPLLCFVLLNTSRTPLVALLVVHVVSTVSTFLNTSTRSGHCSDVSDSFQNTLTFVELVLVSFSPLCRSNLLLLMFHSLELLQYFDLYLIAFKSFSVLLLFVFLFNIAVPNLRTPSQKEPCTVHIYKSLNKLDARWIRFHFS